MAGPLKSPDYRPAAERVRALTRERFGLGPADVIAVSEASGALPGFPPVLTAVQFWTADGRRHHFQMFKPLAAVRADDLPFAWQKDALAVADDFECSCC
jgi:hypothetical protein